MITKLWWLSVLPGRRCPHWTRTGTVRQASWLLSSVLTMCGTGAGCHELLGLTTARHRPPHRTHQYLWYSLTHWPQHKLQSLWENAFSKFHLALYFICSCEGHIRILLYPRRYLCNMGVVLNATLNCLQSFYSLCYLFVRKSIWFWSLLQISYCY